MVLAGCISREIPEVTAKELGVECRSGRGKRELMESLGEILVEVPCWVPYLNYRYRVGGGGNLAKIYTDEKWSLDGRIWWWCF